MKLNISKLHSLRRTNLILLYLLILNAWPTVYAATPWMLEPGSKQIYLTSVYETFDRFFRGGENAALPDDIDQTTYSFGFLYGLRDNLLFDIQTGYTQTEFSPATRGDFEGRDDSRIGISWRLVDEFIEGPLASTVTLRLGYILKGDYESSSPGNPHSPGDGASGIEGSILLGKALDKGWALSGELGYRDRESRVPSEYFYNFSVYKSFQRFTTSLSFSEDHATSGVDIGDPGITPNDFEQLEEVRRLFDLGINYRLYSRAEIGLNYAKVVGGRNTGKSDIFALTTTYSF